MVLDQPIDTAIDTGAIRKCDQIDCLRAAIEAIPRHQQSSVSRYCLGCGNRTVWEDCPIEAAHRMADGLR